MKRTDKIKALRPEIDVADTSVTSEEIFQNTVLRPILKFQNDLIITWFEELVVSYKLNLTEDARGKLKNLLSKNASSQSELKGIIIGHFTAVEFKEYSSHSKALGKRIIDMAIERFLCQR